MPSQPRILIAGDPAFRSGVGTALGTSCTVVEAANVAEAADALLAARPEAAIVDLRPGAEGDSVCRRIKGAAATRLLPIIGFITGDGAAIVAALDAGADHVAQWPPTNAELQARIRAVLRNRAATERLEDATQVISRQSTTQVMAPMVDDDGGDRNRCQSGEDGTPRAHRA